MKRSWFVNPVNNPPVPGIMWMIQSCDEQGAYDRIIGWFYWKSDANEIVKSHNEAIGGII